MKIWSKLLILSVFVFKSTTSYAVLSDHCTWPSSSDTFSERSTGYVVTSTDWNKAQCALNNLQAQLGTSLQNILKLSANNTISGNSTFTGDVTFSDFASCTLGVDSNGKLGCTGSSQNCSTIMGCEAKDTDAKFLSLTGGPCNPSTGTCVFELSANWVDISSSSMTTNSCRIAVTNQGRLQTLCKDQSVKSYLWTSEGGGGTGTDPCPSGQALVGSICKPVTQVLINNVDRSKVDLTTSASIVVTYNSTTGLTQLTLAQGSIIPLNLLSPQNTTATAGQCVKTGDDPQVEFEIGDCFNPVLTTSQTECLTLLAGAINCPTSSGCVAPAKTDGTNFSYSTSAFATDADDVGSFMFKTPSNLTGTTAAVKFGWISNNAACSNGTDDDVCWTIDGDSFAHDAAFNSGSLGGTEIGTSSRCTANGDIIVSSPVTFTHSMAANETAILKIRRDTDETIGSCSDDYAQNAELAWVEFCYEVGNMFSGE